MCASKPMLVTQLEECATCSDLRMNVFFTLAMDRASYCNHLGNRRWKLTRGSLVIARGRACCSMYRTNVKAYKKKFNAVKDYEKTPQLRVGINGVDTRRVKFSLLDSTLDEEVIIGDEKYKYAKVIEDDDEVKNLGGLKRRRSTPYIRSY